ncbi:proto-oncogene tyrosine-protein kinase receptor Ret [Diorhabda carinulata]|uniref:proto-oncogene tyrosine-protein kinase receptor Ret n=1 Tax=Diorhabda carinulata TaxID=1163345 RepID=UPI00259FF975|nr:proto-oncogene tyrosine-protein kinase receptor Ret [Diorhabda carinulata]
MKDIKDVGLMWIFMLQAHFAYGIYFTMSDIKLTISSAIGNSMERIHDHPIFNLSSITVDWNKQSRLIYSLISVTEIDAYIRINESTGGIFLNPTFFHKLHNIDKIPIAVTVEDTINYDSDNMTLELDISPFKEFDCNKYVKEICFWEQATYKIERKHVGVPVGPLSSLRLQEMCPYTVNYTTKGDALVQLIPPTADANYWSVAFSGRTRKNKNYIKSRVSCTVETVAGLEKGTIRTISKEIEISLLDIDRYPPRPQRTNITIELYKKSFLKGEIIDDGRLIFMDDDPENVNNYEARIEHGNGKQFITPICQKEEFTPQNTYIHCRLQLEENITFSSSRYSFKVVLNDTSLKNKKIKSTAEFPIDFVFKNKPQSLTLLKLYPSQAKIFRTAAPLARVSQPTVIHNCTNFTFKVDSKFRGIFNVTKTEGIVYVNDFSKLRQVKTQSISLNISWINGNKQEQDEITIRIINEPNQTCTGMNHFNNWTYCSEIDNIEDCLRSDSCALGTGGYASVETRKAPERCMWRGDEVPTEKSHLYSTCTPDIKTCPDGICDSLEQLRSMICPQDCVGTVTIPLRLGKSGRGVDEAAGIVYCSTLSCSVHLPGKYNRKQHRTDEKGNKIERDKQKQKHIKSSDSVHTNSIKQNITLSAIVNPKCGFTCIAGIVAGSLFFICSTILIIVCWRVRKTRKSTRHLNEKDSQELTAPLSLSGTRNDAGQPLAFNFQLTTITNDTTFINTVMNKYSPDPKWEFPRSQLIIEQTLGEGEFGKVLRAKALNIAGRPGYTTVAVKTLKNDARESELSDLLSEYQLLKEVSHPNVIRLLGVCTAAGGPVYLIIEYAEFGSLRNYLRRTRHVQNNSTSSLSLQKESPACHYDEPKISNVTSKDLLSFAWQICNGMAFLTDMKLVHRDLAARNVLLAEDKVCKISDFGLTRDVYEDNAYLKRSKGRVPVKWMAPESLADHIYTSKSDVWSFGILIWELVTLGATPYPGIAVQNLFHLLRQGYRMERPDNCSPALYKVMRKCWHIDPDQRPSFHELSKWFEKLLEDKMEYINLSNNAIYNRGYFISPFEEDEDNNFDEDDSSDISPLNLLSRTQSLEKCEIREKILNDELEKMTDDKISNTQGYETPVKIPRRVKTPSNEDPQEYTEMGGK